MVDLYRIILLDIRMTWLCWCSVRFLSICPLEDLWHWDNLAHVHNLVAKIKHVRLNAMVDVFRWGFT
jgi:hypothetical protein